ncbi:class I SAM-dependent methyltransferase [Burkholderia vietnamiensis]|uniref:class I SAM-dependent methyltransferase n=1 Tax=Burkholderia vietnamiensis TaxID=60552 RepID=UPI000A46AB06|nr:class I SAM-dependent methyltransferase [Burkholderia vietnamiensis]
MTRDPPGLFNLIFLLTRWDVSTMSDPTAEVFSRIYREQAWHSSESVSGWGSELRNTERIIRELPGLLQRLGIRSILDVPCGDFNWMRHVDLDDIRYIGADIVEEIVRANQAAYASARRSFVCLDLLKDRLPDVDLILCRDCLFHFSPADVFRALHNLCRTNAQYVLTTTFTYRSYPRNGDIQTGGWTPINLEMAPYDLPPPRALLIEGSHESITYPEFGTIAQYDRCLGLWEIADLRARLRTLPPGSPGTE